MHIINELKIEFLFKIKRFSYYSRQSKKTLATIEIQQNQNNFLI